MAPWQLTLSEYRASLRGQRVKRSPAGYYNREGQIQADHRAAVEAAHQLGQPIPATVLTDYPHLACKHPAHRIYTWLARDDRVGQTRWGYGQVLCAGCCDCGAVLAGGAN